MKKVMTGWLAALVVLASAGSLLAHHSLANYDTSKAVHVKGAIFLFRQMNPHSLIYLDEKLQDGKTQRWAIEGPSINQLTRLSFATDKLKPGDVVELCGYVTKESVESQRTIDTEPISLDLKATTPKSVSGRIMNGEMIVMPDGEKRSWGDYGVHKCFEPGFQDVHTR
jgi:Family of unknown function (DUF6152)